MHLVVLVKRNKLINMHEVRNFETAKGNKRYGYCYVHKTKDMVLHDDAVRRNIYTNRIHNN